MTCLYEVYPIELKGRKNEPLSKERCAQFDSLCNEFGKREKRFRGQRKDCRGGSIHTYLVGNLILNGYSISIHSGGRCQGTRLFAPEQQTQIRTT